MTCLTLLNPNSLTNVIFRYVAFARDAGNIAAGAKDGARVIYGDGCKFSFTIFVSHYVFSS
jgi:hypothetical protein